MRAQDFVDSWIRLLSRKSGAGYATFLFDVENAEAFHAGKIKDPSQVGVKALGDGRASQVKLRRRVPYFLHIPSFWVTFPVRSDLIRKYGSSWATPGEIATLGPYLLKEWKKGKSILLERNAAYYHAAPAVARIEAVVEPDEQKARALFVVGKLDFLLNATTEDLLLARSEQNAVRVEQFPYLAHLLSGIQRAPPVDGRPGAAKGAGGRAGPAVAALRPSRGADRIFELRAGRA